MTTQYKYLTKEDIIQEGDEYRSSVDGWVPTHNIGLSPMSGSSYRRHIPAETKQYRDVKVGEVLQKGDEALTVGGEWKHIESIDVGVNLHAFKFKVRRHIPAETKQYRDVKVGEVLQKGDEFLSIGDEWVCIDWAIGITLHDPNFKVRRHIPSEDENEALKTRLENALKDIVIAEARKDEYYRKVVERGNYINNLTARLMGKEEAVKNTQNENKSLKTRLEEALSDKVIAEETQGELYSEVRKRNTVITEFSETISEHRMTIRRLTDKLESATTTHAAYEEFLRHVAEALGMRVHRISFQDVLEKVKSLTSRNASLDRQLKDALTYKAIAKAELDKVRDAVKKLC